VSETDGKTGAKTGNGRFVKGVDPRRGHGVKGRSGRPRKAVRDMLIAEFEAQIPLLKREVTQGKLERVKFAELCAKYGMGTTITETDTEGDDVPRPGILAPDERRAALIRELSRN
jgi:hypothetical protein